MALRPVSAATRSLCEALEVTAEQRRFVAPVTAYLADAASNPAGWAPLSIHAGGETVGFVMWAVDPDDGSGWIGGLVIDRRRQGRGLGRAAMGRLLELLRASGAPEAGLTYHEDNVAARALYSSLGFRETGERNDDGEIVARLRLAA